MDVVSREVFAGISPAGKVIFYLLATISLGWAGKGCWSRVRLWRQGYRVDPGPWGHRLRQWAHFGLGQRRLLRRRFAGSVHLLVFSGFLVLTLGTLLLALDYGTPWNFYHGPFFCAFELLLDLFGGAFVVGSGLVVYRRLFHAPPSLSTCPNEFRMLALMVTVGITGFLLEGLRILEESTPLQVAVWSPGGYMISHLLSPLTPAADWLRPMVWWLHGGLALTFLALLPWRRASHALASFVHLWTRPVHRLGTPRVDAGPRPFPFSGPQLVSLDACMACGRCDDVCPATAAGESLKPKELMQGLRHWMSRADQAAPFGEMLTAEAVWTCTLCQACGWECPPLCDPADFIVALRRQLAAGGEADQEGTRSREAGAGGSLTLPQGAATVLRHLAASGNPWGHPPAERNRLSRKGPGPLLRDHPHPQVLYWVGCVAAFEERAQAVAERVVQLLLQANVDFALLGEEETCTGDVARRLGDEQLFQQLAGANIATLNSYGVRRIVTACPHCFHTLRHDYPALGGKYEVLHHTTFLAQLVESGQLHLGANCPGPVTYHDPCHLGRINGVLAPPRALLQAAGAEPLEMARHGPDSACCGAGGGRFWRDERRSNPITSHRLAEAQTTGARTLVTACPFCLLQMGGRETEGFQVQDVAEVLVPGTPAAPPEGPLNQRKKIQIP